MYSPRRFALLLFGASLVWEGSARAQPLREAELIALSRGETIRREHVTPFAHFVGGVTYTVVDAAESEIDSIFDNIDAYARVLPRTKHARFVGTETSGDRLVEISQGSTLLEVTYTVRIRRIVLAHGREVRFWLDPTRHHDIEDAWGFFRFEPFLSALGEKRVLLTYGILVDPGPGVVREWFEAPLRAAIFDVPQRIRRYVAQQRKSRY